MKEIFRLASWCEESFGWNIHRDFLCDVLAAPNSSDQGFVTIVLMSATTAPSLALARDRNWQQSALVSSDKLKRCFLVSIACRYSAKPGAIFARTTELSLRDKALPLISFYYHFRFK